MHGRWSKIASYFPGRTDNEIKNHWNTRIKKKLKVLGLDPVTHKPLKQPAKCDSLKSDSASASNIPSQFQEKSIDIMDLVSNSQEELVVKSDKPKEVQFESNDGQTLLLGNVMPWENLDIEDMKPRPDPSSSSSTSFSMDDTLYPSSVQRDSSLEGSNICWFDTDDYFPSWEALYPLEDIFPFGKFP